MLLWHGRVARNHWQYFKNDPKGPQTETPSPASSINFIKGKGSRFIPNSCQRHPLSYYMEVAQGNYGCITEIIRNTRCSSMAANKYCYIYNDIASLSSNRFRLVQFKCTVTSLWGQETNEKSVKLMANLRLFAQRTTNVCLSTFMPNGRLYNRYKLKTKPISQPTINMTLII